MRGGLDTISAHSSGGRSREQPVVDPCRHIHNISLRVCHPTVEVAALGDYAVFAVLQSIWLDQYTIDTSHARRVVYLFDHT